MKSLPLDVTDRIHALTTVQERFHVLTRCAECWPLSKTELCAALGISEKNLRYTLRQAESSGDIVTVKADHVHGVVYHHPDQPPDQGALYPYLTPTGKLLSERTRLPLTLTHSVLGSFTSKPTQLARELVGRGLVRECAPGEYVWTDTAQR